MIGSVLLPRGVRTEHLQPLTAPAAPLSHPHKHSGSDTRNSSQYNYSDLQDSVEEIDDSFAEDSAASVSLSIGSSLSSPPPGMHQKAAPLQSLKPTQPLSPSSSGELSAADPVPLKRGSTLAPLSSVGGLSSSSNLAVSHGPEGHCPLSRLPTNSNAQ